MSPAHYIGHERRAGEILAQWDEGAVDIGYKFDGYRHDVFALTNDRHDYADLAHWVLVARAQWEADRGEWGVYPRAVCTAEHWYDERDFETWNDWLDWLVPFLEEHRAMIAVPVWCHY